MIDDDFSPSGNDRLVDVGHLQLLALNRIEGYMRWTMAAAWLAAGALLKMAW